MDHHARTARLGLGALASQRNGPGILILSMSGQLQYMSRRTWELLEIMHQATASQQAEHSFLRLSQKSARRSVPPSTSSRR